MTKTPLPSDFKAWISETLVRAKQPSSPYFKFLNKYSVILAVIAYILVAMDEAGVFGASAAVSLILKILAGLFTGMPAAGALTVNSQVVDETEEKPALPYTEKKQIETETNSNP